MSTTKKTGGWAVVGEMLLALFGFYAKAVAETAEMKVPSVVPLAPEEIDGAAQMGISRQELLTDLELRKKAGDLAYIEEWHYDT